jgi:hypothetical protein
LQAITSSANDAIWFFNDNDTLGFYDGGGKRASTQVFRDTSAWYHFLLVVDTPNSTIQNRARAYVNGVEITSWTTNVTIVQNKDTTWNAALAHQINANDTSQFSNQYIAEFYNIDGQALTPSSFTETNATTGQLIPKAYTGSYGTNGFHLDFANTATAGTLGLDSSGNGNNWTAVNLTAPGREAFNLAAITNVVNSTSANYTQWVSNVSNPANIFDGNSGTFASTTTNFPAQTWFNAGTTGVPVTPGQILTIKISAEQTANTAAIQFTSTTGTTINASYTYSAGTFTVNVPANAAYWSLAAFAMVSNSTYVTYRVFGAQLDGVEIVANQPQTSLTLASNVNFSRLIPGDALQQNDGVATGTLGAINSATNTITVVSSSQNWSANTGKYPVATSTIVSNPNVDALVDTPTSYGTDTGAGGEVRGNYCTWNPLRSTLLPTNGNLQTTQSSPSGGKGFFGTIAPSSGKYYFEIEQLSTPSAPYHVFVGFEATPVGGLYRSDGKAIDSALQDWTTYGASYTNGAIIGIAVDVDSGTIQFFKNGVSQGVRSGFNFTTIPCVPYYFATAPTNVGLGTCVANFGQRPFAYTAPSGFKALCDTNLPTPVVAKPNTVMDTVLYTGNGAARSITGLAFNPDLVWLKSRSAATDHELTDSVRGVTKSLSSNLTAAEATDTGGLTAFNSNGFSLGTNTNYNNNAVTYAAWAWDAGTSTVTNTAGSITSQVRANASAGFSVVTYTGTGANATVGHGLGIAPSMVIVKQRSGTITWRVYHASLANTQVLYLSATDAATTETTAWNSTTPTSSVVSLGTGNGVNGSSSTYVAYCFAPVSGYSSFGSYTGNGSTDGPFVYTGFRPRWVMIKNATSAYGWAIHDTQRGTYNVDNSLIYANASNAEATNAAWGLDILSNGFKPRTNGEVWNNNTSTYIYACFAESPFAYARAR